MYKYEKIKLKNNQNLLINKNDINTDKNEILNSKINSDSEHFENINKLKNEEKTENYGNEINKSKYSYNKIINDCKNKMEQIQSEYDDLKNIYVIC